MELMMVERKVSVMMVEVRNESVSAIFLCCWLKVAAKCGAVDNIKTE